MAHTIGWYVDKRVLLISYQGDVDKAELRLVNQELDEYLSEAEPPVHLIADSSQMGDMEMSLQFAQETFSSLRKAQWGYLVLINFNTLLLFFGKVLSGQFGIKIRSANSLEDAYAMLQAEDSRLLDKV